MGRGEMLQVQGLASFVPSLRTSCKAYHRPSNRQSRTQSFPHVCSPETRKGKYQGDSSNTELILWTHAIYYMRPVLALDGWLQDIRFRRRCPLTVLSLFSHKISTTSHGSVSRQPGQLGTPVPIFTRCKPAINRRHRMASGKGTMSPYWWGCWDLLRTAREEECVDGAGRRTTSDIVSLVLLSLIIVYRQTSYVTLLAPSGCDYLKACRDACLNHG